MTMVEPLPDLQWGKGTWQDYISNWRTRDTNWMQERLILRYQTTASLLAAWPSPQAGQVIYNDETGIKSLQMYSAAKSAWLRSLMFQFLGSNKDDAAGVNVSHTAAGGKGATFGPTSLLLDAPTTNFLNGTAVIDATGLLLKVGTNVAIKLSTDANSLVSDTQIKAPALVIAGAISGGALTATSVAAPAATITNISMSGTLSGGGVINGGSGLIGGVTLGGSTVQPPSGFGMQSGQGWFYGDGNSAVMRQRPTLGGATGAAYVQVTATGIGLNASTVDVYQTGPLRILNGKSIQYYRADNGVQYNGGPVIVGADPGVGNVPEGTIWVF
jgi:hypothetical protein